MELNKNLLDGFAEVVKSVYTPTDEIELGYVMLTSGYNYEVLLDKDTRYRYAGIIRNSTTLTPNVLSVHDGIYWIYAGNRPDLLNINPVSTSNTKQLVNGVWTAVAVNTLIPDEGDVYLRQLATVTNVDEITAWKVKEHKFASISQFLPCNTIVRCIPGDRVAVRIHNNTAYVIANLTSPAATIRDLENT